MVNWTLYLHSGKQMKAYLFVLIIMLGGCSTVPLTYNPDSLNEDELARVTTLREAKVFGNKYNAWIEYVWNDHNVEITNRNAFWDNMLGGVHLPPGRYKFQVSCVNGSYEGHTEAKFSLEANKEYQLSCNIGKGENIFGMSIDTSAGLSIREVQ